MIGRGTRNLESCKHRDWLQEKGKNDILILDFKIGGHSNVKYHDIKVGAERGPGTDVITRIFENRIELLDKPLDEKQKKIISNKILYSIDNLDEESSITREKLPAINTISKDEWVKYVKGLYQGHFRKINLWREFAERGITLKKKGDVVTIVGNG